MAATTSSTLMLLPGSASAPTTFDGNEEDISEFLEYFIYCADMAQLPSAERVSFFFRYLSKEQKDFFRVLDGYTTKDWVTFEKSIREEDKKQTKRRLLTLVGNTTQTPIKTAQQLRESKTGRCPRTTVRHISGADFTSKRGMSYSPSFVYAFRNTHETNFTLLPK